MKVYYYVEISKGCKDCGKKHMICSSSVPIGKHASNSPFLFFFNGGRYYKNITELKEWLNDKTIVDSYGNQISCSEFWQLVNKGQFTPLDTHIAPEMTIDRYRFTDYYIANDDCEDCCRLIKERRADYTNKMKDSSN